MAEDGKKEDDLFKHNIDNIQKDAERLKLARQLSLQIEENLAINVNENQDNDELSLYTSETESGKVLDSTSIINRKAIFHDMGRLKSWKESVDKLPVHSNVEVVSSTKDENIDEEPSIMEKNIYSVLGELPDINVDETSISSRAASRLSELESKIKSEHTFKKE